MMGTMNEQSGYRMLSVEGLSPIKTRRRCGPLIAHIDCTPSRYLICARTIIDTARGLLHACNLLGSRAPEEGNRQHGSIKVIGPLKCHVMLLYRHRSQLPRAMMACWLVPLVSCLYIYLHSQQYIHCFAPLQSLIDPHRDAEISKMSRSGALDDAEIQTEMNKMARCFPFDGFLLDPFVLLTDPRLTI